MFSIVLAASNIVISNSADTDEPWILATNKNPTRAIKDYGYRFGDIESIFKNLMAFILKTALLVL